jgi:hypothetical protein
MFEEKREAVMAIEAAVLPLIPTKVTAALDAGQRRSLPKQTVHG